MKKYIGHTYKIVVILLAAYISMLLVKSIMNHTEANIGLAAFVMVFMFVILYVTLYWMPSKLYGWFFRKSETHKKEKPMPKIDTFEDLLKRGNLPDDDRIVPNWLKIKNDQFEEVDFSHNTVDDIIALPKELFLRFYVAASTGLFLHT